MQDLQHILTYRYMFHAKDMPDGKIGVKYVSETLQNHDEYVKRVLADDQIVSCVREYVGEYDCDLIGFTESVKDRGGIIDEKV